MSRGDNMDEKLKKALIDSVHSKINDLQRQKEQVLTKSKNLDKLSELVITLEDGFENLRKFSRETLEKILSPYCAGNALAEELDRLEIVRFVFEVREKGHNVELNEEEIDIMVNFLEKIRSERNIEVQKYERISLKNKEQLEEEIKLLNLIEEKIAMGENGTKIIIGKEIDKIMQLATTEEADEDVQISILCLLNKINLGIDKNLKNGTI